MIEHVVLIKWKTDCPSELRARWLESVRQLPEAIAQIRSLRAGEDVVRSQRSWDAAVIAEFASLEDMNAYREHPAHQVVADLSGAGADKIVSVDFDHG